jgi:hypothetical protein
VGAAAGVGVDERVVSPYDKPCLQGGDGRDEPGEDAVEAELVRQDFAERAVAEQPAQAEAEQRCRRGERSDTKLERFADRQREHGGCKEYKR